MITVLRNNLKDGGMITIVWIAVGSMIIGSALPLVMKKNSDNWALKVNGTEIPYTTYAAELAMARDYISMLRAQYGQFADYLLQSMGMSDPQAMTVQQLVTSQLMVDGYKRQGISISPQSIAYKLSDKDFIEKHCGDLLPSFLYKDGILDNSMLKTYLQRRNMTIEQLEERLQDRIGSVFMQQALQSLAYVPKASLKDAMQKDGLIKDILVIGLPLNLFKKTVTDDSITVEALKDFYNQENARDRRYYTVEKRSGELWQFKPESFGISIDDQAIEQYYEEHKTSRYTQEQGKVQVRAIAFPSQQQAEAARAELINKNVDMVSLAKEYPFDEQSAKNQGLLAPIIRGSGDRTIEKAAFILAQDGDISPVLAHKNRFILLERINKTAPILKSLAKVRDEIEQILKTARFKETCMRDLKELIQNPLEDTITLFAKNHKGVRSSLSLIQSDAKTEAEMALFALEPNAYTAITQGSDCYLVHLNTIVPSELQEFESIKDQVRTDLILDRAEKAMEKAAMDFLQTAQIYTVQSLAQEKGYTFNEYNGIKSSDTAKIASLRKEGIDIGILNKLEKPGTYTLVNDNNDKLLIFLKNTSSKEETLTDSAKRSLEMGILKKETDTINSAYIASLYRDAKIEKNDILALLDEEIAI